MKYVGTFLFLFGMYWTWGLAKNDQAISQQVHVSIQDDLKKLIADYIQQNLPNSTNLRFERFWTEANTDNQVKATFTYSFEDTSENVGATRVQIEGYAVLNRVKETSDSIEWSFDKLEILSNSVDYKDPINVTPAATEQPAGG
ncbi:MAG: hypothetical protein AB7N80_01590 [Bdellovibrionales bacterium]